MNRMVSCSDDISMLNTTAASFVRIAALSTRLSARAVFSIDGRPATTMRSPLWNPAVCRSRSMNPVGTPVTLPLSSCSSSTRSITPTRTSRIGSGPPADRRRSPMA